MKILHVTNYFRGTHNHIGGAEQACFRTALMTLEHDHEVLVVTKRFDKKPEGQTLQFNLCPLPVIEDYLPKSIAQYMEAVKWYALQYDYLAKRSFKKILSSEMPEVIHFHNFQFLTFSLLKEAYNHGIPMCMSIYDYWHFCPKAMLLNPDNSLCKDAHGVHCIRCLPKKFIFIQRQLLKSRKTLFDNAFELIDRFIVLSENSAGVLKGYGIDEKKIRVIPLSLPIEYNSIPSPDIPPLAEHSILFAGWLNDRKGVHIAIQAMPQIIKEFPKAVLYIIGGRAKFADDYEKAFERFIEEKGLHNNIVFLGHQGPEVVKAYLQRASVLVIPEQYENMSPLIMIEAMMLGKPIVASNLGGIPEYIIDGKTGLLANAYSAEDFAEKTVMLLKDREFALKIGYNAQQEILSRNNNKTIWGLTESLYKELLVSVKPKRGPQGFYKKG